jgi:hypothetical protein
MDSLRVPSAVTPAVFELDATSRREKSENGDIRICSDFGLVNGKREDLLVKLSKSRLSRCISAVVDARHEISGVLHAADYRRRSL